jgi:Arc/MetJ-type ribon-helix-helix transcriptional regulator
MIVKVIAMATRQISVTLEEDLVRFLDETTNNRSAAISEALEQWRDLQWQRRLSAAYAELNEAARGADHSDAVRAAAEAAVLAEKAVPAEAAG